jgi:O-antigen/teichoic acid export membrane protein
LTAPEETTLVPELDDIPVGIEFAVPAEDSYQPADYSMNSTDRQPFRLSGPLNRVGKLVAHRGVLTLLDQGFVSLTNFSTGILIGRYCSKGELGLYMLGYSVILFAVAFQQMLVSSPYILIWPRLAADEAARYTSYSYLQQLALGAILSVGSLLAALAFYLSHSRLGPVMAALAFAAPLLLFKEMFRRVCFTQLKLKTAILIDFALGILQVVLLVLLARSGHLSAPTGMLAVGASCSLLACAWLLRHRRRLAFNLYEMRAVLIRNWHLGRWIFGSQILWALSLYSYPWLVSSMHGVDAAGVWAACFGINALGNPLLLGLQNYVEPRVSHAFAEGGIPRMRRLAWKSTGVLAVSMLLFSLAMFVVGNRVAVLLYGPKYAGNGLTISIIALSFAIGAAGFALSCGFFAAGRGNLDVRISFVFPLSVLICGLPLVKLYGPLGGAISLLIGYLIASSLRAAQFLVTFRKDGGQTV